MTAAPLPMTKSDQPHTRVAGALKRKLLTAVEWLCAGYALDAAQGHAPLVPLCYTDISGGRIDHGGPSSTASVRCPHA